MGSGIAISRAVLASDPSLAVHDIAFADGKRVEEPSAVVALMPGAARCTVHGATASPVAPLREVGLFVAVSFVVVHGFTFLPRARSIRASSRF